MPRFYRPSAADVAMLTIYLIRAYDQEKGKTTTRARLSEQTLRVMGSRINLRAAFKDEWIEELAALGWSAFPVGDHFGIIRTETTEGWVRIGSKRIRDQLQRIHRGDVGALAEIEKAIETPAEPDDDE